MALEDVPWWSEKAGSFLLCVTNRNFQNGVGLTSVDPVPHQKRGRSSREHMTLCQGDWKEGPGGQWGEGIPSLPRCCSSQAARAWEQSQYSMVSPIMVCVSNVKGTTWKYAHLLCVNLNKLVNSWASLSLSIKRRNSNTYCTGLSGCNTLMDGKPLVQVLAHGSITYVVNTLSEYTESPWAVHSVCVSVLWPEEHRPHAFSYSPVWAADNSAQETLFLPPEPNRPWSG